MNDRYSTPYQGYSAHSPSAVSAASASVPSYETLEYEPPFLLPIPGDMTVEPHPLPLYNQPSHRRHMRRPAQSPTIRCEELMKTVDLRFITPPPSYRRHSFALSSIYEEDEEEESDVLTSPVSSTSSASSCFPNNKKFDVSAKIVGFLNSLRDKLSKASPTRVIKSNSRSNLDLLL